MTLRIGGAAVRPSRDGVLLDLTEEMGLGNSTSATAMATVNRGTGLWVAPAQTGIMTVSQGGITTAFLTSIGRTVRLYTSAATPVGCGSTVYKPDVSPLFQAAGAVPVSVLPPLLTQTFSMPCIAATPGTAKFQIGFAQSVGNTGMLFGTTAAAVWESDPAVFGGNWYPRIRTANGGAITDGNDSGIPATSWHTPGIRYVPGAVPRLEWLIDGAIKYSLSGDANMLALQTALPGGYVLGACVGAPVGAVWHSLGARWRVEEAQ